MARTKTFDKLKKSLSNSLHFPSDFFPFPEAVWTQLPGSPSLYSVTLHQNLATSKPVTQGRWSRAARDKPPQTIKFISRIQPVRCLSSLFVFGERKGKVHLNSWHLPACEQLSTMSSNCHWCCLSRRAELQAPVLLSMQSSLLETTSQAPNKVLYLKEFREPSLISGLYF